MKKKARPVWLRIAIISSAVFLTSCGKTDVYSVQWYQENEKEREAMLQKCMASPDLRQKDDNCLNASQAQFRSGKFTPSPHKEW